MGLLSETDHIALQNGRSWLIQVIDIQKSSLSDFAYKVPSVESREITKRLTCPFIKPQLFNHTYRETVPTFSIYSYFKESPFSL